MVGTLFDRIVELECKVNKLEQEMNRLKNEINKMNFFSVYQDWVKAFMNEVIKKLGGVDKWLLIESGLHYIRNDMEMTDEERQCVEDSKRILGDKDIGTICSMTL
ncbi:hypothetical protein RclHR1_12900004 [Rhizophagus clarus]|nr:hypothetical protein RclHR1_12900004 [Rhizophagus clarus]